jgi:predicted DNA-binding transcriptional regulator YafY
MNRRGFMWAVVAIGLGLCWPGPAAAGKSTGEVIHQALTERRVLLFKYHGYERRVEPHALGRVTENRPALLGWQELGGSASEPPPGWRTFLLAEMESVKLLRQTFAPRPDYRPEAIKLKPIEAEVATAPLNAPAGK